VRANGTSRVIDRFPGMIMSPTQRASNTRINDFSISTGATIEDVMGVGVFETYKYEGAGHGWGSLFVVRSSKKRPMRSVCHCERGRWDDVQFYLVR